MVCLPTFTIKINLMQVNIPYMDPMRLGIVLCFFFLGGGLFLFVGLDPLVYGTAKGVSTMTYGCGMSFYDKLLCFLDVFKSHIDVRYYRLQVH